MKTFKIYCMDKNAETDAVIIDRHVLMPMPRRSDMEPAYIEDGLCYYPPYYAAAFTRKLECELAPFSVICEWNEFMDFDEDELPMPDWVARLVNGLGYSMDYIYISDEKYGYCDTKTGQIKIAPQWERCYDFDDDGYSAVVGNEKYGIIDYYGDVELDPEYNEIRKTKGGVFLTRLYQDWGAVVIPYRDVHDIYHKWADIWWDGLGGYTVKRWTQDEAENYCILNSDHDIVAGDLTEMPVRYDPPSGKTRKTSYRDDAHCASFRIIQRSGKYGLVRDYPSKSSSTLLLDPIYTYEYVLKIAGAADMDAEIHYYAMVMSRTPRKLQGRVGDGWDTVPKDIRDAVLNYMKVSGMEQPETVQDLD